MAAKLWDRLTDQEQKDLLDWFNVMEADVTSAEKSRLAKLLKAGRFHAWDCPQCQDRVYFGDPEDWGHFQGAKNADYASYPGGEAQGARRRYQLCDHCRCHGVPTDNELDIVGIGEPSCWPEEEGVFS